MRDARRASAARGWLDRVAITAAHTPARGATIAAASLSPRIETTATWCAARRSTPEARPPSPRPRPGCGPRRAPVSGAGRPPRVRPGIRTRPMARRSVPIRRRLADAPLGGRDRRRRGCRAGTRHAAGAATPDTRPRGVITSTPARPGGGRRSRRPTRQAGAVARGDSRATAGCGPVAQAADDQAVRAVGGDRELLRRDLAPRSLPRSSVCSSATLVSTTTLSAGRTLVASKRPPRPASITIASTLLRANTVNAAAVSTSNWVTCRRRQPDRACRPRRAPPRSPRRRRTCPTARSSTSMRSRQPAMCGDRYVPTRKPWLRRRRGGQPATSTTCRWCRPRGSRARARADRSSASSSSTIRSSPKRMPRIARPSTYRVAWA